MKRNSYRRQRKTNSLHNKESETTVGMTRERDWRKGVETKTKTEIHLLFAARGLMRSGSENAVSFNDAVDDVIRHFKKRNLEINSLAENNNIYITHSFCVFSYSVDVYLWHGPR